MKLSDAVGHRENILLFRVQNGRKIDHAITRKLILGAKRDDGEELSIAILVCFFRNTGTIAVEDINVMKG